ncbi:hypothetical protein ACOME3_002246 [Neoechinorhynchus agilis]
MYLFLFGLLVYGDERLSEQCAIIHSIEVDFAIQCGSNNANATTLIDALNSKANESIVSLSIAGVGINEIPTNLSNILTNVTILRLGYPPSGEYGICTGICTNKLYNIEILELINMNISEMEFMNSLPELKDLTIFGGEMAQLDDSFGAKLPNLEILSIRSSKLSSLGVIKKICSLSILILSENKITSLDIDNATCFQNLMLLDLQGNAIASVAIDHRALPQLKYLRIDFHGDLNQLIKSLNLPQLLELNVIKSNSTIFNVSNLQNLPKLKILQFKEGKLERVPIGNQQTNDNILALSLANNNISIVNGSDFEKWTNLHQLYLNQNNIKKLSSNLFSNLINLRVLDLRNNSISELHNDTFQGLTEIKKLFYGGNSASTIPDHILAPMTSLVLDTDYYYY